MKKRPFQSPCKGPKCSAVPPLLTPQTSCLPLFSLLSLTQIYAVFSYRAPEPVQCVPAKAFTNRLLSDAFHTYTILFPRLFASVILPKIRQNVNRNRRSKYSFRKYHPKRASKTLSQTLSVKLQKLSF